MICVIPPVYVGVFKNVIVCVDVVVETPSPDNVAVTSTVPPELALPVSVTFPLLATVQKLLEGAE